MNEPILTYVCEHCGRTLRIPRRYAGTKGTCKRCGNPIAVPPQHTLEPLAWDGDRGDLVHWIREQVKSGIPCEVVLHHVASAERQGMAARRAHDLEATCNALVDSLLARFEEAQRLEASGRQDDAVRLYERQLREGDLSGVTHERLWRIYRDRGQVEEAVRVCLSYMDTANRALANGWVTDTISAEDLTRLAAESHQRVAALRDGTPGPNNG